MLRFKNKISTFFISLFCIVMSTNVFAARIAETQGTYFGTVVELLVLVFNAILFLASLLILLLGGWFMIKDYVIAKSDHDKSFSIGKLVVALVVASLLGYPSGAYLLGQDLTTGDEASITQGDFERPAGQ